MILDPKILLIFILSATLPTSIVAQANHTSGYYNSPNSVDSLIEERTKEKKASSFWDTASYETWKHHLDETYGLNINADYHLVGFTASNSLSQKESLGGVLRIFSKWKAINKDNPNTGSLIFKGEYRHAISDVSPVDFGSTLGYVGLVQSTYSDQRFRLTNLYWQQKMNEGEVTISAGFLDVTDYLDVYILSSPWNSFGNLVFATGSATIGVLPDSALGVMAGGWLSDSMYAVAGIVDAHSNPNDPFSGFNTLVNDFDTFKSIELGWTTGKESLYFDNFHISLWQIDARMAEGTKEGYGVSFSLTHTLTKNMLGFFRGGYSKDGGALLSKSLSTGFGYKIDNSDDLLGVGLNWGEPNSEFYGEAPTQWTSEIFYRYQSSKHTQITPSVQLLKNPALNPDSNFIALFGLRLEVTF